MAHSIIAPPTHQNVRKISDRKIHIVTAGPVMDAPPGSDCSQEPASPSRTELLPPPPSIPKLPRKAYKYLKHQHPSLEIISARVRLCTTQEALRSLVIVFNNVVQINILPSIADLPFVDRSDDEYRARHFMVEDKCRLLIEQASKVASKRASCDFKSILAKTLALLDLTIEALHELIQVAEQLFFAGKPLPEIPTASLDDDVSIAEESTAGSAEAVEEKLQVARRSLTAIVEEVLSEPAPDDCSRTSASFSIIDYPTDTNPKVHFAAPSSPRVPQVRVAKRLGITQRIYQLQQVVQRSKSSLTLRSFTSRNSKNSQGQFELEDSDNDTRTYRSESSAKSIKMPYSYRQSIIFSFLEGEERPDMPMPALDEVFVNQEGKVMQTTFDALFLQVTSNAVIKQPELLQFFFCCFRFCIKPEQLVAMMESRFVEEPPENLTPAQLKVWVRSNEGTKHRVRNLLHTWLHFYWEPACDDGAVAPLLQFSLTHLHKLNDSSTIEVFNLAIAAGKGFKSRQSHLRALHAAVSRSGLVPVPQPTKFFTPGQITDLKVFMNPRGRVELARQLTTRSSAFFAALDGTQLVRSWYTGCSPSANVQDMMSRLNDWSKRLSFFVTSSILTGASDDAITKLYEFWLEVMMECLHLNNFHDAVAIFTGLDSSAAHRPKVAIVSVDLSHKNMYFIGYKLFFSDFNMKQYRHVVRGVRDKVLPHTLVIDTLSKDVSSAKAVKDCTRPSNPNIINFTPFHVLNATIESVEAAQLPYKFTPIPAIQLWLDRELAPFEGRQIEDALYQQSLQRFPRSADPLTTVSDPWQRCFEKGVPVPVVKLRIDLDKIFAINHHDPQPEDAKERRATMALLRVSAQ